MFIEFQGDIINTDHIKMINKESYDFDDTTGYYIYIHFQNDKKTYSFKKEDQCSFYFYKLAGLLKAELII